MWLKNKPYKWWFLGELGFKENDIIQLINRVDDNWFEGSLKGRTGYFPQAYVEVKVPLPT